MNLKKYQAKVMDDLREYLSLLKDNTYLKDAWDKFWKTKGISIDEILNYKDRIKNVPYICFKVPTGGGKTFMACASIKYIFDNMPEEKTKAVVWLVPNDTILEQTTRTLSDPNHPYRDRINSDFGGRVAVFTKAMLLNGQGFSPDTVREQLSICILSYDSLRINSRKFDDRKLFQENGNMKQFSDRYTESTSLLEDVDRTATINAIRQLHPVVLVDEAHNTKSDLSLEMLNNLNPSFVLELTATPREYSNILSYVSAVALKKEDMVKLPLIVYREQSKTDVITDAYALREALQMYADEEHRNGGNYIRPIILFQAEPKTKDDSTTFEDIKKKLIDMGIPAEEIAINTDKIKEIKGVDLLSEECKIKYIITVNALKEGWDCPFAYILASLANRSSKIDVEQIVGRILRQPYTSKSRIPHLNNSYVFASSIDFNSTLEGIVKGLNGAGFSDKDWRLGESRTVSETSEISISGENPENEAITATDVGQVIDDTEVPEISDNIGTEEYGEDEINTSVSLSALSGNIKANPKVGIMLESASKQNKDFEEQTNTSSVDDIPTEFNEIMKTLPMNEQFAETEIILPQFCVNDGIGFDADRRLLAQSDLKEGFKLEVCDAEIKFDSGADDAYIIDVNERNTPTHALLSREERDIYKSIIKNKSREELRKHYIDKISSQLSKKFNDLSDSAIKEYVDRVISGIDDSFLSNIETMWNYYAAKIEQKIKEERKKYMKKSFFNMVENEEIICQEKYALPKSIKVQNPNLSYLKTLYTGTTDDFDSFEKDMVMKLSSHNNIEWWYRNPSYNGFFLNYYDNHYPDFIAKLKSGKIILIETKGNHLENPQSEEKAKVGKIWAELSGRNYRYYMVFKEKAANIKDSCTVAELDERLNKL